MERIISSIKCPTTKHISLDWHKRAAICTGTASGISFLQEDAEQCTVHRDIKASNVLLDKDLVPKIGYFGLVKLFPDSITLISTCVAGTLNYLALEYALLGQLTKNADIYSFGVVLLEVISLRSNSRLAWGQDLQVLVEKVLYLGAFRGTLTWAVIQLEPIELSHGQK
ncbi:cold-responsive protein kinase 1-like [Typha latifolia]|uniref:cold-responsive protein kinase 1-like n=1 Tax=Typha latifolia TaxID=4733 RepID=UPI003C2DBB89